MLDERLRSNEHATVALLGTLQHQVFQVYYIMESLTRLFCWKMSVFVLFLAMY